MNKLYTAQEVADRLKIKKTTVYELIKRGELESSKIGKQLRVSEEQLTQYLNRSSSGNSESGQDIPYTFVNFEHGENVYNGLLGMTANNKVLFITITNEDTVTITENTITVS